MKTSKTLFSAVVILSILVTLFSGCGRIFEEESDRASKTPSAPVAQPQPTTVTRIIDGDTIVVGKYIVRLVGIDAPDRGECGYATAKNYLTELIDGKPVVLIDAGVGKTDRYQRLLKYVTYEGNDVGLLEVKKGFAIAAYDSRTKGYKRHDRQDTYVRTDSASKNVCPGMSTKR